MKKIYPIIAVLAVVIGQSIALANDDSGISDSSRGTGPSVYSAFGADYQIHTFTLGAKASAIAPDIQAGYYFDPSISAGLHMSYGYATKRTIRFTQYGGFLKFNPAGSIFYGRFLVDLAGYQDSGTSKANQPFKAGSSSGLSTGIAVGLQFPRSGRFKIAPEASFRATQATSSPTIMAFGVKVIGDLW